MLSLKKGRVSLLILAVTLSLTACAKQTTVDKVESIKDQNYAGSPKTISFVQSKEVDFSEGLRTNIIAGLKTCGTDAKFFPFNNFKNDDFYKRSDSVMQVAIMTTAETTNLASGYASTFLSKATYEFTLQDLRSQKIVWRSRMEFDQADPHKVFDNAVRGEQSPDGVWAKALVEQMKKDGLLANCNP